MDRDGRDTRGRPRLLRGRRDFLKLTGATAGLAALAGCGGDSEESDYNREEPIPEPKTYAESDLFNMEEWRGSGPLIGERPSEYEGVSMLDLPDMRGELTVYLGGGEGGLYVNLLNRIQRTYRDFNIKTRKAPSSQLANTLVEEARAGNSPADVFWAIDAGSVGVVANNDATESLPEAVGRFVPGTFYPSRSWVGVMGRARSVPYNTDEFDAADIPNTVMAMDSDDRYDNMGWAPTYGAFQSFITAMRLIEGESRTREWLNGMQGLGIGAYNNELVVANRVADGELSAGFSNHYYSRLVRQDRPDAPLELAFTQSDPGALINCSATEVIKGTDERILAENLILHLLSVEAQEFLGTRGYEYPLVPSVPPVGDLPAIDELNPPEFDLTRLADVEPTLQLLRDVGVL